VKRDVDDRLRRLVAEVTREVAAEATVAKGAPSSAAETLARAEVCASSAEEARRRGPRAVVTTTGKNRRGIVANIAQAIAEAGGDIVDISQTLVSDYFTMIIVVDTTALAVPLADF
jgi:ACT domain-containing protein